PTTSAYSLSLHDALPIYGLANASKEALWLRSLLRSLSYTEGIDPVHIEGDNQGSLALTDNPEFHQRTKHIDIRHHFLRQKVTERSEEHTSELQSRENLVC